MKPMNETWAIAFAVLLLQAAAQLVCAGEPQPPRIDTVYDYKELEKSKATKGYGQTPGLVEEALAGDLAGVEEIVLATRTRGAYHYYETFGHYYFQPDKRISPEGGRLIRLDLHTGRHEVLLEDLGGSLRDPCVSYDGKKILFSWLKTGTRYYQLYEMDIDGSNIRRITNAPFNDVEPIYLPDGDIVFASSRAGRGVPCWKTPVGLLHRCEVDGSDIRMLSNGIEHEIRPWLLHDGRIIYNRWEYVNRSETKFHHLWTMNPDGTCSMTYFGNHVPGFAMTEAKPIPGSDRVLCIFSPGHGRRERQGYVTLLSPQKGPDDTSSAVAISQSAPDDGRSSPGVWRDPNPFSEETYLACWADGVYVMNRRGEYEVLWKIPEQMAQSTQSRSPLWVHEPMPMGPRPKPPVIAERVDLSRKTATLVLQDMRMGRSLDPREAAKIDRLLVMEVLPSPVSFHWRKDTVSVAGSNYSIKRILGTVPVEEDGSGHLEVPAMRNLYFIALDAEGNNLKEMQSFVNLMPGEVTGCVGCHEQRIRAPHKMPSLTLQALDRSPSRIQPLDEAPESGILHFPRDIQPILGKHCAGCHNWNKPSGGIVLSDDIGPGVHHSIHSLARKELLTKRRRDFLSKFTGGHHDVEASPEELRWLRNWFFTHGQYSGTYGSLGTRTGGTGMPWAHPTNKDHAPLMPNLSIDTAVLESRCDSCHLGGKERKYRGGQAGNTWPFGIYHSDYFNLSNPEKSLILLAPLAREAGGLGLCRNRKPDKRPKDMVTAGDPHVIFKTPQDPGYQALLAQVRSLAAQARRKRVFPVENWRPVPDILREMKRYGALGADFDIRQDEVDPFKLDEAYYRLFYPGGRRFRSP